MPKGISQTYAVVDRHTGDEVQGLFVLDPVRDPSARAALLGYARAVEPDNWKLASDLRLFVDRLESKQREQQQLISGSTDIPDWLLEMDRVRTKGMEE